MPKIDFTGAILSGAFTVIKMFWPYILLAIALSIGRLYLERADTQKRRERRRSAVIEEERLRESVRHEERKRRRAG